VALSSATEKVCAVTHVSPGLWMDSPCMGACGLRHLLPCRLAPACRVQVFHPPPEASQLEGLDWDLLRDLNSCKPSHRPRVRSLHGIIAHHLPSKSAPTLVFIKACNTL
jgi:hypothetical protein